MTPSPPDSSQPLRHHRRSRIVRLLPVVALLPVLLLLLGALLAATPLGARYAGRNLSLLLGQPVTIEHLHVSGRALTVEGLAVRNLPPFTGELFAARSLTVIPSLRLLGGTPSLTLLEIRGGTLDLKQDRGGGWNLAPLLSRFRSRPGGGEGFIGLLRVGGASLKVNGRVFPLAEVTIRDLATKGSRDASWQAGFTLPPGRPVTMVGTFRPGSSPAFSCRVDAPEIPLPEVARLVPLPPVLDLKGGTAALRLTASYGDGILNASGTVTGAGAAVRLRERAVTLAGTVEFAGRYRADRDEAEITRGRITLAGLAPFTGSGVIRGVRKEREFSVELASGPLELGRVRELLLPGAGKGVIVTGTATLNRLSLAGTPRQGVTSGRGRVALRNGNAWRQGTPLIRGVTADLSLTGTPAGWRAAGSLTSAAAGAAAEVRSVRADLTAALSPRLAPLTAEIAPLSGTVRGIDLHGWVRYSAAAPEPLTLRLATENAPLAALSPYRGRGSRITGGTADATLSLAAGREARNLHGTVAAALHGLTAVTAAGKSVSVARGSLDGTFRQKEGTPPEAAGRLTGSGTLDTVTAEAAVSFFLTPALFRLEQGSGRLGGVRTTFAGIRGRLPPPPFAPDAGFPVEMEIERLTLAGNGLSLEGVAGRVAGEWRAKPDGGRFVGTGDFAADRLSWRFWSATELSARLAGDGGGIVGELAGKGVGGTLTALLGTDPAAPGKAVSFAVSGRKLLPAQVMTAVGRQVPVTVSGGLLDADLTGSFSRSGGARLTFASTGSGLTLVRNGTTILSGLGVAAEGEYDGGRLRLREGRVAAGERVGMTFSGEVRNLPLAARTGTISFSLPESPLTAVVNASAGLLPPALQEITTEGTLSLKGTVALGEGKTALDGELHVTGGSLALPSRQFSADGIEGTVPVSLIFPAAGEKSRPRERGFSRESYPRDLTQLQQPLGTPAFRVGRVRFGALETGEARFHLAAAGGRTELVRVATSLYDGELLGRAALSWDTGPIYDADLLIHDLSLRRFCSTIPAINGYLSGKVDGVAGLHGERGRLDGAMGFFDIWTRSAAGEEMLVSREFLQKLAGKKLKGFFFRDDRAFDHGRLSGNLSRGDLTFTELDLAHTNIFGVRDLSVTVVPSQNRISLEHLLSSIRTAVKRGKPAKEEGEAPAGALPQTEFKWLE